MATDEDMRSPSHWEASDDSRERFFSMTLDDIIASNKRIAASATRSHGDQRRRSHGSGKRPYVGSSPAAYPSPFAGWNRRSPRRHKKSHRLHPYSTPQISTVKPKVISGNTWKVHVSNVAPAVSDSILKVCEAAGNTQCLS